MELSILPFLPHLQKTEFGALRWPSELGFALKSLVGGPSTSQVHGSEALCDFINDLREQSHLPLLSNAILHGITTYFDEFITRATAQNFFQVVLPSMGDLAFRLPLLLNDHFEQSMKCILPIKQVNLRVLEPQQPGLVYMTQELVAAILACAFFCLFPSEGREEARLPYFNFDGLFRRLSSEVPQQEQKLHCILQYFTRVSEDMPQGMISFERKVLLRYQQCKDFSPISEPDESYWSRSCSSFCPIQVSEQGLIEDQNLSALEIDFANRYLGGGVLRQGCVQEEIRFVISPELIAGMLFMPAMHANEAIEIRGAERFSCYAGYASSFCFTGNYVDTKPRDLQGRWETRIVAIDALVHPGKRQYEEALMLRETNKAFCGFLDHLESYFTGVSSQLTDKRKPPLLELHDHLQLAQTSDLHNLHSDSCKDHVMSSKEYGQTSDTRIVPDVQINAVQISSTGCAIGIATGNWGCGAFGGDVELKSLLQWIAASQAGRPFLQYFTFDGSHGQRLQQVVDWIISEQWVVGELWGLLIDYGRQRLRGVHNEGLFEWILPHISKADAIQVPQQGERGSADLEDFYYN